MVCLGAGAVLWYIKSNNDDDDSEKKSNKADNTEKEVVVDDTEMTETEEETEIVKETESEPDIELTMTDCETLCENLNSVKPTVITGMYYENMYYMMADVALSLEYINGTTGDEQRLYSELNNEEQKQLDYEIVAELGDRPEFDREYNLWTENDYNGVIKKDGAEELIKDFYGKEDVDWEKATGIEKNDTKTVKYVMADGEPWYRITSCEIKETQQYALLEGTCFYEDNSGASKYLGNVKYLFVKNQENKLGARLVYSEFVGDSNENLASYATASSTLPGQNGKTYDASNLIDGNLNTSWVEGVEGNGEGQTIEIGLGLTQTVHGVIIYNGYLENKYLYQVNGKVNKLTITGADGTSKTQDLYVPQFEAVEQPFSETDLVCDGTAIQFDAPIQTDKITITILGATPGEKYQDTCISEIKVY